jgi:tetratricopeptide (TPR) repeat protein
MEEGKRASELDPLSPQIPIDNLLGTAWQGKYQAAKGEARKASELDPAYFMPHWAYGWIDIQAGKFRDAIPELQKAKAMDAPTFVGAWLGYAYGGSGDRTRALARLRTRKKSRCMVTFRRSTWRLYISAWGTMRAPWITWKGLTPPIRNGWGGSRTTGSSIRSARNRASLHL